MIDHRFSALALALASCQDQYPHTRHSETLDEARRDCSNDGYGRLMQTKPEWVWNNFDGSDKYGKTEITEDYYERLGVNVTCLPSMAPTVRKALADGKITWNEYDDIGNAQSRAYDLAKESDRRVAASKLQSIVNPPKFSPNGRFHAQPKWDNRPFKPNVHYFWSSSTVDQKPTYLKRGMEIVK